MSGDNRMVFLYFGLIRVMFFFLDMEDKWVFWVDYEWYMVDMCGYDGSDRRVFWCMNGVFISGL